MLSIDAQSGYGVTVETQTSDPADWPRRLTAAVGQRIRQQRTSEHLSAQDLADRTRMLGHEVKRSVIADMENGRRPVLPTADLLVLAHALNVPPLTLLVPVGSPGLVEIAPGLLVDSWEATDWAIGSAPLVRGPLPWPSDSEGDELDWQHAAAPLVRRQQYEQLAGETLARNSELRTLLRGAEAAPTSLRSMHEARLSWQMQRCHDALVDLQIFREKATEDGFALPEVDEASAGSSLWERASTWLAGQRRDEAEADERHA